MGNVFHIKLDLLILRMLSAANLGLEMGRDKLVGYLKNFGFGKRTGIELANEYSGS